ncbi:MAG: hypothetical protein HS130_09640 [Deltaproteobacteria bacterium]|nr:hypothetical protein [Deltaproteobacteria bacterium]MCL4872998.1 hypothetical protein [bacterium]
MNTPVSRPEAVRIAALFLSALCMALLYTWPVITDMSGSFYGFPWDSLGSIHSFWWFRFAHENGIPFREHAFSSYPAGVDLSDAPFFYTYYLAGLGLTLLTDEVAAYNIIRIASFPLLAVTSYLLMNHLVRDWRASMFSALAFAFSPLHTVRLMSHQPNLFWAPLLIYLLLRTLREGGLKLHAAFGFALGLALVDSPYFAYFFALLSPVLIAMGLKWKLPRRASLTPAAVNIASFSAAFAAAVVPMALPVLTSLGKEVAEIRTIDLARPLSDLFVFSAKPLDYLLPSRHNFFLGQFVPDLGMGALKGHRYIEHTLYLGWTLLALGLYAVYRVTRKNGGRIPGNTDRKNVYAFLALAVAAALLSGPPFLPLGGFSVDAVTREVSAEHRLYLPQYYLFHLFPFFRSYARLGVFVGLGVSVLAAFGMKELLARTNSAKKRAALLGFLGMVLAVEFAEFPGFRITNVDVPGCYGFLAGQEGDFAVIEYPVGPPHDPYTSYEYLFHQRAHGKRLVNGSTGDDKKLKDLSDISDPRTLDALAGMGVNYILLHRHKYERGSEYAAMDWITGLPREKLFPKGYNDGRPPDLSKVRDRLREVADFGPTVVYEIREGPFESGTDGMKPSVHISRIEEP